MTQYFLPEPSASSFTSCRSSNASSSSRSMSAWSGASFTSNSVANSCGLSIVLSMTTVLSRAQMSGRVTQQGKAWGEKPLSRPWRY
ncbi:putative lipoprotein [Burkholderia mallei]|nr:putative lipoprotein [Burkholderia pseudomallei]KGC56929.1 putative lipoprotein [Burkholderia mallei]KGX98278.1 putative lipoprotein [Burkholderia pseudomallei A79D]KGC38745.1 putative lipoprotein [Burkholderia pseudomallei]KGD50812.1 putative lipoprotein [Burkholderia pseudomallei]